jgi:cobalt-zinc-cadmium resistance protein CzcA
MSLGALDFGIIVDGAVVIVENCVRRLAHAQATLGAADARRTLRRSVRRRAGSAPAAVVRAADHHGGLPIFALTGVEGKMFHPMALTVVMALAGRDDPVGDLRPAAVALFIGDRVGEGKRRMLPAWYGALLDRAWPTRRWC